MGEGEIVWKEALESSYGIPNQAGNAASELKRH